MLYNVLIAANIGIAIANTFVLVRCWRTMRKIDQLQAETWETLGEAIIFRERLKKQTNYADPTD